MLFVTNPKHASRRDMVMLHIVPPAIVLAAFLFATFWSWQTARDRLDKEYQRNIDQNISTIESSIEERLASYSVTLGASAALFRASDEVTRSEWRDFQNTLNVSSLHPGVLGIGYAPVIDKDQLSEHTKTIRQQGFDNYNVRPKRSASTYAPVVFPVNHVTPPTANNSRSFGFDMYSDKTRRRAMQTSVDNNRVTMSDMVGLQQNQTNEQQPAFILYLPVYKAGAATGSLPEREAALSGFVFAPFQARGLFEQLFADNDRVTIGLQVYDASSGNKVLLYENDIFKDSNARTTFARKISVYGHEWTIHYKVVPSMVSPSIRRAPISSSIGGAIFSMLIAGLVWTLLVSRTRSIAMTEERELQQAKDDVLSIASHQLRTPATGVKQYIGMLQGGFAGELSKEQQKLLKEAYVSNERQLHIIDEMLHVARIDTGQLRLQYEDVNLADLLRTIIRDHRQTIHERKQTINLMAPRKSIWIQADSQYLRMALENIIGNASKYTYSGGSITVSLRGGKENITIKIRDTGVGIDKKDFPLIFQKFSRIHNELSRQTAGSGVGLYVAKKIIDMHGGTISFTSIVKEGTTFTVRLPRLHPSQQPDSNS